VGRSSLPATPITHYKPRLVDCEHRSGKLGATYYFLWEQGERQEADPRGPAKWYPHPRLSLSSCPYKPEQKFQLLYVIIYIVHSEHLLLHCRFVKPCSFWQYCTQSCHNAHGGTVQGSHSVGSVAGSTAHTSTTATEMTAAASSQKNWNGVLRHSHVSR
jgi:hypothetical protein